MIENSNEEINFNAIINILEEENPEYSTDVIRSYVEDFLIELFKDHILTLEIPKGISVEELRKMRTALKIREKSGRWAKKIDSFRAKFKKNLNYLKLKNIQDNLRFSMKFAKFNYLSGITDGSELKYIDDTFIAYNGNREVDTHIKHESIKLKYDDIQTTSKKKVLIDSKTSKPLKSDFDRDIGSYTDTIKELEKLDKREREDKKVKIPIDSELLEEIRRIELEPIEKKEGKYTNIKDFKKYLDEMDNSG